MTDTEEVVAEDETTEESYEDAPFLRITSTTAKQDGHYDTITVELNLDDEDDLGEAHPDGSAASWLIDLVTSTVREMRGAGQPPTIVVNGAALRTVLSGHVQHDEGCDGSCGIPKPADPPTTGAPAETPGHPGSDRWTTGDRKDEI